MRRILSLLGISVAGATAGHALYQLRPDLATEHGDGDGAAEVVIGAPLSVALIAFVAGLITGRRGRLVAFITGLGTGAAFGTQLDTHLRPVLAAVSEQVDACRARMGAS